MTKMLFSGSLEQHMAAYMQDVKLNELNQQYQLAQMQVVREGERMQLSQADIMIRLDQLKEALKQQAKLTPAHIPKQTKESIVSSQTQETQEKKRPPPLKTTPKGTIIGLPEITEITEGKRNLRKTSPKETSPKKTSPFQQALTNAGGKPSKAKAQARSQSSSPTGSEATTVATTEATSANPPSPVGELPRIHFNTQKGKLKESINSSTMKGKLKKRALLDLKNANNSKDLNEIHSKLLNTTGYSGSGLKYKSKQKVSKRKV